MGLVATVLVACGIALGLVPVDVRLGDSAYRCTPFLCDPTVTAAEVAQRLRMATLAGVGGGVMALLALLVWAAAWSKDRELPGWDPEV
jgi:hypothetical protein